jgi:pimeloyl-ACP methyl ester carboxylesterase
MRTLLLLLLLLLCCVPLFACATAKSVPVSAKVSSPSLHQVKQVKVADSVALEVLDFGGQGPALVFLAGLGDTGHIFDTFAPEFTGSHHVYSVTRRGLGSSSWPAQGYDTATLGADVVGVLDGLGLARASLAGHSVAGPEITWVATHHPERVEKVVYLDPKADGDLIAETLKTVPMPKRREPAPEEVASRATVATALTRGLGAAVPEHEIDEGAEFDGATGRYLRDRARPDVAEQVGRSALKADFADVRAPVLFIYTGFPRDERAETFTDFSTMTPLQQETLRVMVGRRQQRGAELESLMASRPNWKGVKLEDAGHYVWFTNRDEVLREMKAFLGTPRSRAGRRARRLENGLQAERWEVIARLPASRRFVNAK